MAFDLTLNATQFRLVRGDEENPTGYKETFRRSQLLQQDIGQVTTPAFVSRADTRGFYQTSWAGGSRWERPLVTQNTATTYDSSRGFDSYTKGGILRVLNSAAVTSDTNIQPTGKLVRGSDAYYIGGTTVVEDATNKDIYTWTPASDAFTRVVGSHTATTASHAYGSTYFANDGFIYVIQSTSITRFDPVGGTEGSVLTGLTAVDPGANIFIQDGRIVYYNGNIVQQLNDPGGAPNLTTIATDGMGVDLLNDMAGPSGRIHFEQGPNLAIGTSDGIFYVKNVEAQGQPQVWIYRIDRDSSGTDISTPIASLPVGIMAINIGWHLGSLVIAATADWQGLLTNLLSETGDLVIQLWHVTGENVGLIGIPLGVSPDETVSNILGSSGPYLYLAGHKRIWVYDAISGGLHPIFEDPAPVRPGYVSMAVTQDSANDQILFFLGNQDYIVTKHIDQANATTVAGFDTDTTTYRLESNYFDFDLPLETKELVEVTLNGDGLSSTEQYSLEIDVDDGGFTQRATITNATYSVTDLSALNLIGRRFRYALVFETTSATTKSDFRGLRLTATTGELVRSWDIWVDGSEFVNVENQPIDPEQVFDDMRTIAALEQHIDFIPDFEDFDQTANTTFQVKIALLDIVKGDGAGENKIHLVLVEA